VGQVIGQQPEREQKMVESFLTFYQAATPEERAKLEAMPNFPKLAELGNRYLPGSFSEDVTYTNEDHFGPALDQSKPTSPELLSRLRQSATIAVTGMDRARVNEMPEETQARSRAATALRMVINREGTDPDTAVREAIAHPENYPTISEDLKNAKKYFGDLFHTEKIESRRWKPTVTADMQEKDRQRKIDKMAYELSAYRGADPQQAADWVQQNQGLISRYASDPDTAAFFMQNDDRQTYRPIDNYDQALDRAQKVAATEQTGVQTKSIESDMARRDRESSANIDSMKQTTLNQTNLTTAQITQINQSLDEARHRLDVARAQDPINTKILDQQLQTLAQEYNKNVEQNPLLAEEIRKKIDLLSAQATETVRSSVRADMVAGAQIDQVYAEIEQSGKVNAATIENTKAQSA
jgi:hypothetical protein